MNADHLAGYVVEKRASGVPWAHIANMAGCASADLLRYRDMDLRPLVVARPAPATVTPPDAAEPEPPADEPPVLEVAPPRSRRGPGGLVLAVLYAVGDGYSTSMRIANLLGTTIDNANGALRRLEADAHVERASSFDVSPVVWMATDGGMAHLRVQMVEGFE